MKKFILPVVSAFALLTSFGPEADVKQYSYDVLLDARPIGTHTISRTGIGDAITFKLEDHTSAGLIRKADHRFEMLTSFEGSQFISSDMKTFVDEKLQTSAVIVWDGSQYIRQDGEQLTEIQRQPVTYSAPCMFFEEPMNRTTLFYEKFGAELEVHDLGNHRYEVHLPNGAKERYTYKDGEVVQVDVVQTFATITLLLKS